MCDAETITLFKAFSENLEVLKKAKKQLKKDLNSFLKKDNIISLRYYTFFYALMYSALMEASFKKLIFTPYGFSNNEIEQIISVSKTNISQAWIVCLEIALPKVYGPKNVSFLPNAKKRLKKLIDQNITKPYEIRNKIAHGQWSWATNKYLSKVNNETSRKLQSIDYIEVDKWFETCDLISHIMEMLIVSPKKGFTNNYWRTVSDIENKIYEMSSWTMEKKKEKMKSKQKLN